jgi:hypothetical protein
MLEDRYLIHDVAEILGVTTRAVARWRREGKLRPVTPRSLYYPESELNRFLGISVDGEQYANENVDEDGNSRGELAAAQAEANLNAA